MADVGGGVSTVLVAVALLSTLFGSAVVEETVAVLLSVPVVPLPTVTPKVIVSVAPEASELKVTVRLLPDPPHTPPPVALHEL